MAGVPGTDGTSPGPALERRQACEEVERFEQAAPGILPPAAFVHPWTAALGRAVVKRALEPVHDQAVGVPVEPLEYERGTRDMAA